MSTTAAVGAKAAGIRGGHVLAAMLAFFAVIIVADATLIYKALTTFGGVDNPNAYRQGVAYNQRIARDAQAIADRLARRNRRLGRTGAATRDFARPRGRLSLRGRRSSSGSGVRRPIVSMLRSS